MANASELLYCITEQQLIQSVTEDAMNIRLLSLKQRTYNVIIAALTVEAHMIKYLTPSERTPEICKLAVMQDGRVIQYLSKNEISPDIIKTALENTTPAFFYLWPEEKPPDLCFDLVKDNEHLIQVYLTADQLITLEFYEKLMEYDTLRGTKSYIYRSLYDCIDKKHLRTVKINDILGTADMGE